jgi:hypothetical protein
MTTDYSKTDEKRAQETVTEQDTPQDKERIKITPTRQETRDKELHRRATASHGKAIPKEQEWDDQEEPIEGDDYDEASCPTQAPTPLYIAKSVHGRVGGSPT